MVSTIQSPYSDRYIAAWLRGLLTIAWADGHYDPEEQELITELTQHELAHGAELGDLDKPITAEELANVLGHDAAMAENFMRTAVMVAIADGVYSSSEDEVLHQFCVALELQPKVLESLRLTLNYRPSEAGAPISEGHEDHALAPLKPLQDWLDQLEVHDPRLARFLCKMIPPQCPFERDVMLFGHKIVHIPPMCKLNPLYDQLVGLRFRALSYLADDCKEDVSKYC